MILPRVTFLQLLKSITSSKKKDIRLNNTIKKNNNNTLNTKYNITTVDHSTLSNVDLNTYDNSSYDKNVDNPNITYVY